MAKTLEERGFQILDIHGHPSVPGGEPPVMKYALSLRKYLDPRWKGKSGKGTMEDLLAELPTLDYMVKDLVDHGVKCTPVAWDAETATGEPPCSNDFVAKITREHPEAFLSGWGSVDPWKGQKALQEAERCFKELNLVGLKFQQASQRFRVNDKRFYPLWDLCQQLNMPVQFHTGFTGLGSGGPGGNGIYCMSFCRPIDTDEVAADFPNLKIIMLHAAEPWPWEANMVAIHKRNVVRETSGIWPRYFPENMMYDMNRRLQDKFLFGSEWAYFSLEQILTEWEELDLRPGVMEKIMYKNAIRFLGEDFERVGADLSPWKGNLEEI
ncbi:amidohydrolase family protein [Chloroflexota bacterium]